MISTDVLVAGGGVSGLLIASALATKCSVVLLEQCDSIPRNKYWLTDEKAAAENPHLEFCIDRRFDYLDVVAYDGLRATIKGSYCLWDTDKLLGQLLDELSYHRVQLLTGYRLYSLSYTKEGLAVRANSETIKARLLIDCMGFGSPLVGAKNVATIKGYYILHGGEVEIRGDDVRPIAMDNVIIDRHPAFFELFPTSKGTAHAAIIVPSRHHKPDRSIRSELSFILGKSHYCDQIHWNPSHVERSYFGIVPVGRLHHPAIDRIVFFGEAGQTNPAASATGLTRMLRTYRELAISIDHCLSQDTLGRKHLLRAIPKSMTRLNRLFQESLFEGLLSFDSDDFRRLVQELVKYPDEMINDLVFADLSFRDPMILGLVIDAILRPRGVLGRHLMKGVARLAARARHSL